MDLIKATGNDDVIFPLPPAVKGYEVTEEVFESRHGRQFDEAENRMHHHQGSNGVQHRQSVVTSEMDHGDPVLLGSPLISVRIAFTP